MRLLLPRGSEDNEREELTQRDVPVVGAGQSILVVEDEDFLREAMTDLIIGLGYKVHVAASGREAVLMLEDSADIDLLLTDIVMPGGINGFDLAAQAA